MITISIVDNDGNIDDNVSSNDDDDDDDNVPRLGTKYVVRRDCS